MHTTNGIPSDSHCNELPLRLFHHIENISVISQEVVGSKERNTNCSPFVAGYCVQALYQAKSSRIGEG